MASAYASQMAIIYVKLKKEIKFEIFERSDRKSPFRERGFRGKVTWLIHIVHDLGRWQLYM